MEKVHAQQGSVPDVPQLRNIVSASLMAALIAAGAWMAVPVGPVPIVLQNLFVYLTALLLGPRWGAASLAVYLLAGTLGLPVFAGGSGGIGRIIGPTGGYLLGYLPAVAIMGWIAEKGGRRLIWDAAALICGTAVVYALGIAWLMVLTGMDLPKTLAVGLYPFVPGDVVKMAAAVAVAKSVRPLLYRA